MGSEIAVFKILVSLLALGVAGWLHQVVTLVEPLNWE